MKSGFFRGRALLAGLFLVTIGCDHATKFVAGNLLYGEPTRSYLGNLVRLSYAENPGGFLSLGAGLPPGVRTVVFTGATGIVLVGLGIMLLRGGLDRAAGAGLALFVAGGLSNWVDRVMRGTVVDFLNLGIGPVRTGIFNLADVAIMLGLLLLLASPFLRNSRRAPLDST